MAAPEDREDPIAAWRVWWYRDEQLHPSLADSLPVSVRTAAWPPRDAPDARCPLGWHDEPAPHPRCTCGYYAVKRLATALAWAHARRSQAPPAGILVVGRVALWGRVVEYEDGYRAQRAYPQMFCVLGSSSAAAGLGNRYGVEAYAATWDELEERAVRDLSASPPRALDRSLRKLTWLRLLLQTSRLWKGALAVGASMLAYGLWGLYHYLRFGVADPLTPVVFRILYASWILTILAGTTGVAGLARHGYELELLLRSRRRDARAAHPSP